MTDDEVRALRRYKPTRIIQQVREWITGRPVCDQCHKRTARCTVPIFDVGHFPGATRNEPTAERKEYWCSECRSAVFWQGQEYVWGDGRTFLPGQMAG